METFCPGTEMQVIHLFLSTETSLSNHSFWPWCAIVKIITIIITAIFHRGFFFFLQKIAIGSFYWTFLFLF